MGPQKELPQKQLDELDVLQDSIALEGLLYPFLDLKEHTDQLQLQHQPYEDRVLTTNLKEKPQHQIV